MAEEKQSKVGEILEYFAQVAENEIKLSDLHKFFIDVRNNIAPKISDESIAELDLWIGKLSGADAVSDGDHTFYELYTHRHLLFMMLMKQNLNTSWRAEKHEDGTMFDGWFVAGINIEVGDQKLQTITYHMPMVMWSLLDDCGCVTYVNAPKWDGHTSVDAMERMIQNLEYYQYAEGHVDHALVDFRHPHALQLFLLVHRMPAAEAAIITRAHGYPVCYALHESKIVRLVMASRMGDIGITDDLEAEHGYQKRVMLSDLSGFTDKLEDLQATKGDEV